VTPEDHFVIELTEFTRAELASGALTETQAVTLWQNYSKQIIVDFPTPKTNNQWILTPNGWAGQIPLSPNLTLRLNPKVEIKNIFRMLEYAYKLGAFLILEGMTNTASIEDIFERLAVVLSRRVIARARKGLYRAYVSRSDNLSCVRGRLDINHISRSPWKVKLPCDFHEHTADVEDNQILAWTLYLIARMGLSSEQSKQVTGRAFRTLYHRVALNPVKPDACTNRRYHRLNDDYQAMHALCHFFLSHAGPTHMLGEQKMLPFLIDMARLYEMFVAEWLAVNLPQEYNIKPQEQVRLDTASLTFRLDLVLYQCDTGRPVCVLDTKYKAGGSPSQDDIFQIVTYAKLKNCQEDILVYPIRHNPPLDVYIGDVHVRGLAFRIDGDLDEAGQYFINDLLVKTD